MEGQWRACWVCAELDLSHQCCRFRSWSSSSHRPTSSFSSYDWRLGSPKGFVSKLS